MRATPSRLSAVDGMKNRAFVSNPMHANFSSHDKSQRSRNPGGNGDTRLGTAVAVRDAKWISGSDSFQVLQLTIESLPSGVLVVDADGAIVLVNQQIERLFGYSRTN